jgi:RNA polymerase sigma-54 factor
MLSLSSAGLEQAVAAELSENPALEREDVQRCPVCQSDDPDVCCSRNIEALSPFPGRPAAEAAAWTEREGSRTAADQLLEETRWSATEPDARIAAYLLASLDDHGFLAGGSEAVAAELRADVAAVRRVLTLIRQVGPPAVGARDVRESLILQLDARRPPGELGDLARKIADQHLELLGHGRYAAIAAALGCDQSRVTECRDLIRARCSPFPAPGLHEPLSPPRLPAVPDVILFADDGGKGPIRVRLAESARYALRIEPGYRRLAAQLERDDDEDPARPNGELRAHVTQYVRRATSFMASLEERSRTIRRVVECAADQQRDFVLRGARYLRPLAQADVARELGLHESTVSRAVVGKYMMMPSRAVLPVQHFFRAALAPQEALRQLIEAEERPLSDAELAGRLRSLGFGVARRTVAKYRDELGLPAAPLRRPRPGASSGRRSLLRPRAPESAAEANCATPLPGVRRTSALARGLLPERQAARTTRWRWQCTTWTARCLRSIRRPDTSARRAWPRARFPKRRRWSWPAGSWKPGPPKNLSSSWATWWARSAERSAAPSRRPRERQ